MEVASSHHLAGEFLKLSLKFRLGWVGEWNWSNSNNGLTEAMFVDQGLHFLSNTIGLLYWLFPILVLTAKSIWTKMGFGWGGDILPYTSELSLQPQY